MMAGWPNIWLTVHPFCSSGNILSDLSGYVSDNSGPYNYTNNSDCTWLIDPQNEINDSVTSIDLTFADVQLSGGDTVCVFDGNSINASLLVKITGAENPGTIHSSGNKLLINFRTDETGTSGGWIAGYSSVLPEYCHDTLIFTNSSGSFDDGSGVKKYNNNTECYWLITPENAFSVTLSFTKFDIEHGYDQVKVYNASANPPVYLATYWGHEIPPSLTMTGNKMLIAFKTDYSQVFDGWEAEFTSEVASVQETAIEDGCRILSNPIRNELNIEIRQARPAEITVSLYDMVGNIVLSKIYSCNRGISKINMDVSGFNEGIYFIRIEGLRKNFVSKFVIKK